ncbi:MAG: cell division protein SepF [Tepidanaerobacteraceae bacterium]|jgi:cell division inhibitor SepF|nr:cell division protein SepF [Thermoanaerobacterales bacterium]
MSVKSFFKKILYFLGIEDEETQEQGVEGFDDHHIARQEQKRVGRVINIHQASKNTMVIFKPSSFEQVREITDEVKNRRAAIVNLEKLDKDNAKRVLDFMAGSIYALNGAVKKVGPGIFVFVPDNIDISGVEIEEDIKGKSSLLSK